MAVPTTDILAITYLLKRERYYRDTAQWDLCRAMFHPNAAATYINVAWYQGNVDDFLEKSRHMHRGKANIVHAGFDPVDIRVRDNRATSEAFCSVTSSITLADVDYELSSQMRLFTRLEKLPGSGEWRMLSLESSYVRDRLVLASPGTDSGGPLPLVAEVQAYPKPYRHMALVMLNRGLKPRSDLPHEDTPETIRYIQDRNIAFLDQVSA